MSGFRCPFWDGEVREGGDRSGGAEERRREEREKMDGLGEGFKIRTAGAECAVRFRFPVLKRQVVPGPGDLRRGVGPGRRR